MAIADLLTEVGLAGSITALSAPGKAIGTFNISVGSTANWPSAGKTVFFAMRTINPSSITSTNLSGLVPGTYSEWKGIVGTNTITNMQLQTGSTDQAYPASINSQVFIPVTAPRENALVTWGQVHADNLGNLLTSAVQTALATAVSTNDGNSNLLNIRNETQFDFIASGGVWSGLGYGTILTATMTALICYQAGQRLTVATVTTRAFTASKDTYIDVLNTAGVGSIVYTEVANNAASPALAANSIRIGIIVTGASNIAAATSVNQGQETMVLPIISSVALSVTDSLGNLICPRDSQRRTLCQRINTAGFGTGSTTQTLVTGLSATVITSGRKIEIEVYLPRLTSSGVVDNSLLIWDGAVGSGTALQTSLVTAPGNGYSFFMVAKAYVTPIAGVKTYNVGFNVGSLTSTMYGSNTQPLSIIIKNN